MLPAAIRSRARCAAALLLLVPTASRADGVPDCPATFQDLDGVATFYEADGSGNCGFDPSLDLLVTAVADPDWAGSAQCGRCLEVWGPEATIVVRVVDRCPGCPSGHLDLSAEAFDLIADPLQGIVPIAFRSVPCPVAGNLAVRQQEGSNNWWLGLQVRDHRHAVASVELREQSASAWQILPRADWNYFIAEAGGSGFQFPLDLRITDVHGHVVVENDLLTSVVPGLVVPGTTQFEACAGIFVDGFETGTAAPLWTHAAP
jgi:expansin (peptidoglycan-binding protein)